MSSEDLVSALKERDTKIRKLESECKRLKRDSSASTTTATATVATVSPEKIQEQAEKLCGMVCRGIKSQMKWKASCKHGRARFSYEGMCNVPTFRAFMRLTENDKTKGKRMEAEEFQYNILGKHIQVSIRYGYLQLVGNVNVSFSESNGTIKVTGGYGL